MAARPPRANRYNTFDEALPLLKPLATNALASVQSDLEAASRTPPGSNTYKAWRVFLLLVCSVCLNAFLAIYTKNDDGDETNKPPIGESSSIMSPRFDYKWALWLALGGGVSGALATIIQVLTLMPLRTTLNYQHRHGTTTMKAIKTLHSNGGYSRYYQGLTTALVYRTLARFGDTATNVGILALLGSNTSTGKLPVLVKTIPASLCAVVIRFILTPIDTVGTVIRTEGKPGLKTLRRKIKDRGITCLWSGALAGSAVSFVELYFWFGTYNYLREVLPKQQTRDWIVSRRVLIGFCASLISYAMLFPVVALRMMYLLFHNVDTKIIKDVREISVADGGLVLFGRGWQKRIFERGIQGLVFAVLWKVFWDLWNDYTDF